MNDCQEDLRKAGKAYPRTCALCGLGPCQKYPPAPKPVDPKDTYIKLLEAVAEAAKGSCVALHNVNELVQRITTGNLGHLRAHIRFGHLKPAEESLYVALVDLDKFQKEHSHD